jgi:multidrug efflux pump subunit AcrA (membrane-fusion protein)
MATMKAPFAGRVTEIRARAGQHLRRGEVVMELAEHGDFEVISQVPSAWMSRLQPGNIIWVFVEEMGRSYEAECTRFGGRVNAATRSIRAYARFVDAPVELLPGMGGRADFFPPFNMQYHKLIIFFNIQF